MLGFYREIGYRKDEVVSLGKRLADDSKREKGTEIKPGANQARPSHSSANRFRNPSM